MSNHFFLAIEGPIGVGKTTLARLLHRELGGELLLEVFEENPFLSRFYADRARYAFQTQLFFLLSRFRQQHNVVPATLARTSLVSDYTFAKDRLFAHLNLAGDELEMYERVHHVLAERIPLPTLVVYLRADPDVLMERIAHRDRPYERAMSREYIEGVRLAYERFFADYRDAPVLAVDTDRLDIVRHREDLEEVLGRVRAALQEGVYQRPLPLEAGLEPPGVPPSGEALTRAALSRRLADFQTWRRTAVLQPGLTSDLYFRFMALVRQVGDLGAALQAIWEEEDLRREAVGNRLEARDLAVQSRQETLQQILAGCLDSLVCLANLSQVDLESTYVRRLESEKEGGEG